jgi:capsular exopolysaccharide synthesis family protein
MRIRALLFIALAFVFVQTSFGDTVVASAGGSSCTNLAGAPFNNNGTLYSYFDCSLYNDASTYSLDLSTLMTFGGATLDPDNVAGAAYFVVIAGDPGSMTVDNGPNGLYNQSLWQTVLYFPGGVDGVPIYSDSLTVYWPAAFPAGFPATVQTYKEAGINAGFQNSSIRIADAALPGLNPVYPNTRQNLLLALLFSTLLAVGAAVMSDVLDHTIRDPEQARVMLGAEVVGNLPMVKSWKGKLIAANTNEAGAGQAIAKTGHSAMRVSTGYEEAVRTLRNSILLGTFDHPLKSLMLTSASPAEGKTTIAVHLAITHAQQKHKTLLIDGDLRRPGVHTKLGLTPESGLAAALMNGLCWRDKLIQPEAVPGLYVLPAGPSSRRCADLIGASLKQILEQAEAEYDLVIVDAPPILGFPEPLQMAAAVDGVVMVAVAGETHRKAIELALSTLRRVRANVLGLVLNEITSETSDGYYYHGYYGKYYKYYRAGQE